MKCQLRKACVLSQPECRPCNRFDAKQASNTLALCRAGRVRLALSKQRHDNVQLHKIKSHLNADDFVLQYSYEDRLERFGSPEVGKLADSRESSWPKGIRGDVLQWVDQRLADVLAWLHQAVHLHQWIRHDQKQNRLRRLSLTTIHQANTSIISWRCPSEPPLGACPHLRFPPWARSAFQRHDHWLHRWLDSKAELHQFFVPRFLKCATCTVPATSAGVIPGTVVISKCCLKMVCSSLIELSGAVLMRNKRIRIVCTHIPPYAQSACGNQQGKGD